MDIETSADQWVDAMARLCNSHQKHERDQADFDLDQLFTPILTAPVAQLREFAKVLAIKLKAHSGIPYWIWSCYEEVLEKVILTRADEEAIELKVSLAREIAVMAERGLESEDWVGAITNALKWRPPETLERVKGALVQGKKPKLTGKESCLFLDVEDVRVML